MNLPLRKLWTEVVQKPAGRLVLFGVVLAIFLAFILTGRRSPAPIATPSVRETPATKATAYSYEQKIPPPTRAQSAPTSTPAASAIARASATPKPPPPIPQAIFATRERSRSELFLPFGRLLRCQLVNTVDSINLATPIIGLVTENVWHDGRLIIPAGCEVHGTAQRAPARDRIGSGREWMLVFQDGREFPLTGFVLDHSPEGEQGDQWGETDGSAGLLGHTMSSDKLAEAKGILAAMISAGAGAFPQTINAISPLTGGITQVQSGGLTDAFSAGVSAGAQVYSERLLDRLDKDPFFVRVPAGTTFYLYVTQSVDLRQAAVPTAQAPSAP